MDEIDWIKSTKKAFILFAKVFGGFAIFFAAMVLLGSSNNDWEYTITLLFVALLIGVGLPAILGICYLIINIFSKILNSGRTVINFNKEYIRDLPKHCSPAICSLIYDLKIDVYKDYTATILYLCMKKYVEIIKNGESYKLKVIKEKDYSNLGTCEKYVLDIIQGKNIFDENKFKQEIIKEAQEKELITDNKYSKVYKTLVCILISIALLIISFKINIILFCVLLSIFGAIMYVGGVGVQNYISVVDTEYKRTKDGKNIALLLSGLKRYIDEYTLIKDKEIDYIQILENYIPYALALGEADAVEEFIKYNEEYRDLIYNRRSMQ